MSRAANHAGPATDRFAGQRIPPTLVGLLWISPWLAGFALFMALPIALSLAYSLTDYPLLESPVWIGLDNYRALFSDPLFARVLLNTGLFTLMYVPASTALSILIAVLLNQRVPGLWAFRTAVYIPSLVPVVASAMIWLWLFNADLGLINLALRVLGLEGPNWLGSPAWALPALVIMSLWNIGQPVVVYLAALQDVPRPLLEAASLDGAGPLRRLWHVTLPMISPAILFNVIVTTINTLQVFAIPYIMTEGGPDNSTLMYSHYLYNNAFVYMKMGYASALAWVQFLVVLALTGVLWFASHGLVHYRAA
ncbi:MAG: sugar ABC transporter permease [Planctomycetota bacterium]|nr:sugar ABC transporter permease [Planctomycetota bacterium]